MSFRRALFWSLLAHLTLIWLSTNNAVIEGDGMAQPFAVTLAGLPARPSIATTPPPTSSPTLMPAARPLPATNVKKSALPAIGMDAAAGRSPPDGQVSAMPAQNEAVMSAHLSAPDAEGLRGYRVALAREARRAWRYPQQAVDANWQGTTEIRIELLPGGRLVSAHVEKSSGYAVLDDAARSMMANAAVAAQLPSSLMGDSLSIVVPVKFSLAAESAGKENQPN